MFWNKDSIPNKILEDDKDLFRMDDDTYTDLSTDKILPSKKIIDEKKKSDKKNKPVKEEPTIIIEEIEDENIEEKEIKRFKLIDKILTIAIIVICAVGLLVITDIMLVTRKNIGPFFAIKTYEYNDGGTKVYNGLGYKVIKYNVKNGRSDTVVGGWDLEYSINPIEVDILDLAIDFKDDIKKATSNYLNEYILVTGVVDNYKDNIITIKYKDEDNKYTTSIKCYLNKKVNIKEKDNVSIKGILYDYDIDSDITLYMNNCNIK